ncbi:fluoride efflux transporter CrcB [Sphingomonas sabuli]|uniref:Fluoride-specific ion channel FluC n=1 Tax=Sphingomonas sabuli TaxID=2764186 RepID=A0A7G9L2J5_9SPHN|nr:fluoride efflux transporter CrcB [Sphingomonas sabuli]QNM82844.1 fluoride efflux transporter CrcB [Sphingomonas sabuli]
MGFLIVFLGAGIGGALRHGTNLLGVRLFGELPIATLAVNAIGSLAMGVLAGLFAARTGMDQQLRLFLTTGVLGGFTTFSAFSLDTALLVERHEFGLAAAYVLASVLLSLAAVFVGLALVRAAAPVG